MQEYQLRGGGALSVWSCFPSQPALLITLVLQSSTVFELKGLFHHGKRITHKVFCQPTVNLAYCLPAQTNKYN